MESGLTEGKRGWCERGESNPHGCPLDPKSSASANSATLASRRGSIKSRTGTENKSNTGTVNNERPILLPTHL